MTFLSKLDFHYYIPRIFSWSYQCHLSFKRNSAIYEMLFISVLSNSQVCMYFSCGIKLLFKISYVLDNIWICSRQYSKNNGVQFLITVALPEGPVNPGHPDPSSCTSVIIAQICTFQEVKTNFHICLVSFNICFHICLVSFNICFHICLVSFNIWFHICLVSFHIWLISFNFHLNHSMNYCRVIFIIFSNFWNDNFSGPDFNISPLICYNCFMLFLKHVQVISNDKYLSLSYHV